jgi:hypothetical protein
MFTTNGHCCELLCAPAESTLTETRRLLPAVRWMQPRGHTVVVAAQQSRSESCRLQDLGSSAGARVQNTHTRRRAPQRERDCWRSGRNSTSASLTALFNNGDIVCKNVFALRAVTSSIGYDQCFSTTMIKIINNRLFSEPQNQERNFFAAFPYA